MFSIYWVKVCHKITIIRFSAESTLKLINSTRWKLIRDEIFKMKSISNTVCNLQHLKVPLKNLLTFRECILDETMSGESMALKTISKVNSLLKTLHSNKFLNARLKLLSDRSIIQLHFYYPCST